jgi:hypothetical protein
MAKAKRKKARKAHKKNPRRSKGKRSHLFKKKRRSSARRTTRANPRRSHKRRTSRKSHTRRSHARRATRSNPSKRRRGRRAHRRNPMNPYVQGALAVALSLGVGALEGILPAFIIPKDFALQQKVRMGAGALGTIVGIALVKKHPVLGLAIGAPSFAVLASGALNEWINKLFSSSQSAGRVQSGLTRQMGAFVQQGASRINAVYASNLGGYAQAGGPPRLNAVYGSNLSAVYGSNLSGIGSLPSTPPWEQSTPFG